MATRSGGTPIRTRKVKPGPDQAFTLPKGTSAAPIKNVPVKVKAKPKVKSKSKSEPKKIKAKTKPDWNKIKKKFENRPSKKALKTASTKSKPKKGRKSLGWSKPSTVGGVIGVGGTAAALVAIGRSKDKYRKYRN